MLNRAVGQGTQEHSPVAFIDYPFIEYSHNTYILFSSDQPAKTLSEAEDSLRKHIFLE